MTPGKRENVFKRWNNLIRENINPYTHIFVFYIISLYHITITREILLSRHVAKLNRYFINKHCRFYLRTHIVKTSKLS